MSMNVGSPDGDEDAVISTINTTPLVDVMLVMLIIFLITIPVVTTSIPVSLPKERVEVRETRPENIIISVDTLGGIYWYDQKLANVEALVDKLKKVSTATPQPEVQIRGDAKTDFEAVGRVLYAAQVAGLTKVRFVTDPQGLAATAPQGK